MTTVADSSEDELLARFGPLLPYGARTLVGPGDDCAVLSAPDGRTVVTTDVLVQDRHFRLDWSDGRDVGWRAAVQNLADVAAMGAQPTALVVALVLPGSLPVTFVEDLARGLAQVCAPLGVGVVGGDLSGGRDVVVSVTALGDLNGRAPVLRSGARPGDVLAHVGVRGRSAAGLALLAAGIGRLDDELVAAYLRPVCPLVAGPAAAAAGATAMLDVSDGLVRDARRIAAASGVSLDLDDPAQTFGDELARLDAAARATGASARDWVLGGGEDHGLLATFPPDVRLPDGFRAIGRVGAGPAGTVTVAGQPPAVGAGGWDHFGPGSR
ncbi:thiamine-phosphate kinase [Cellulomonas citrea]|uniref:thiamine-phosphate kinase n=1 Tax=Cellulomonas citrea TaxID=1909423 RepID=UPI0013577258|nr:thiamine-phosphate kinase [Cellulomonas citrea]